MSASEHHHQVALMTWAKMSEARWPELKWLFAIPNGGQRNVIVAKKLKAEGVKKGVSDLCLPVARNGFNGLYIEMKSDKGRATKDQNKFIDFVLNQGYSARVCHGWEQAKNHIEWYMS